MRIVFIYNGFYLKAGVERIWADRINILAEQYDYDLYFLVKNQGMREKAFPLSNKIHFIDLDLKGYKAYSHKLLFKCWYKYKYFQEDKTKLQTVLDTINPDIITIASNFDTNLLFSLKYKASVIVESHEDRSSLIELLSSQSKGFSFIKRLFLEYEFKRMQEKAAAVICLTDRDKDLWELHGCNVVKIPNMSSYINESDVELDFNTKKRVIAAGRLAPVKGFDLLIKSWTVVAQRHPDWELLIYGSAGPISDYEQLIKELNLDRFVHVMPSTEMREAYSNCDFFALSSRHEGFALVLVEALSMGKPCVAFDCPYGPREIIGSHNGLLVQNGNVKAFSEAICRMIEDKPFREQCIRGAKPSVYKFSPNSIMPQWIELYNNVQFSTR